MRREIIEFAKSKFPDVDTLTALEMLLFSVYAVIDDIVFAQEDAEQYPDSAFSAEDDATLETWDYVY